MGKRALLVFLGLLVLSGVGCAIGLTPVVRAQVAREAARRRLAVDVGGVRPGFFAVRLQEVRVRPEGVAGVELSVPEIRVELTAGLRPHEILADAGTLAVRGEPEQILEDLKAWRARTDPGGAETASKGGGPVIRLTNTTVAWTAATGLGIGATGVGVTRDDGGYRFTFEEGHVRGADGSADLRGVRVETDRKLAPSSLRGESAVIVVKGALGELPLVKGATLAPDAKKDEVLPPPLPMAVAPKKAKGKRTAPPIVAPPQETDAKRPLFHLPDPRRMRARAAPFETALVKRLPVGARVDIRAMRLEVHVKNELVTLGPGPLSIARSADAVRVSFSTEPTAPTARAPGAQPVEGTPLSTTLLVPATDGDLTLELAGGPVSLSVLGVQAGSFGLENVEHAQVAANVRLVLAKAGESLTFDGRVHARNVSLRQPRIALDTMRNVDLVIAAHGLLGSDGSLRVDGADLEMGQLHASAHGTVQQTPDFAAVNIMADVAPAACQGIVASIPGAVLPTLRSARIAGRFGATGRLAFDTRRLDELVLDYKFTSSCRITDVPLELSRDRFSHAFTHKIHGPDGKLKEETTGPGTANWTDLEHVSPFMQVAVMTTEDGAFFKHHGFNHPAFRNALVANLKARRFVRGASTITMQLAKNIFLSRDKTLGRKLEELVLTDYLEQVFRKDEMMELYLNVIEFGPNIYGITKAADHFYGRKPEELNLAEAMYLATLLPSPVKYHGIYDRGAVPDGWLKHVRTLMGIAEKMSRITPHELAEGLQEEIVFHKPGSARPPPRAPISGNRTNGDEPDWQPVE